MALSPEHAAAIEGMPYADAIPAPENELNHMLGRAKGQLFLMPGAGFLGSLLCDHDYVWDPLAATAWCNGSVIAFNPSFFTWLTVPERVTLLAHELWHTGYDHMGRIGSMRCHDYWNRAADFVINLDLENNGFVFGPKLMSLKPCLDPQYANMSTEYIYDLIAPPPMGKPMPQPGDGLPDPNGQPSAGSGQPSSDPGNPMGGDVRAPDTADGQDAIKGKIIKAIQSSKMAKETGVIPGETALMIDEFLDPILPWEVLLSRFFNDISKDDYSWKRPSRRYEDEYLPSLWGDDRLEHLSYYLDVSGSVSEDDIRRFNSEVKHIHEEYNPKRLTLVTFDTEIRDTFEFYEDMPFDKIEVIGRGGTDLDPVRQHIRKHQPTAAIIFSDLFVHPMTPDPGIPVLWVVVGNKKAQVHFGRKIHINSEYHAPRVPGNG